jgi:hypothetical protein
MVNLPELAAMAASVASLLAGLAGLVRPDKVASLLGFESPGPLVLVEFRGLFGGMLAALGISCLVLRHPHVYLAAGLAYLGLALGKGIALVVDRPSPAKVVPGLLVDALVGGLLVAGFWATH